ncbi:type I restriction endonuclease subunit R [Xylanimonas cellulosilytica]|uniref:type I restriction endonuclease subunit R n=1 Tax=Xylanimonas cellulosilytica TaxID=186189 RepID=UPI0006611B5C|nr:DEAD/DEAH box helicase family protein [Xylanimonas cellulosilytica]
MSHAQILEYEFESNICSELGERGWLYQDDGDTDAAGWDEGLALVPGDVLHWLATQYPDEYEKAIPADLTGRPRDTAERALLTHLTKELSKTSRIDTTTGKTVGGLLGVLRTGFTYAQVGRPAAKFGPMIVFPPARPELIDVSEASDAVRLRIMRQVRFDITTNETIDVVLCANGIPVVTMELKTDNTQSVNHAIGQYKNDRKPGPKRPLLAPGRVLVHFAVSNDLVFMTTKLAGENTVFLPFNQGNNGHEGNPPSATGSPSNYLWRDILSRTSFMRILKDYALFEPGRGAKKNDGRLVFPRFHQLRAVERIISDIETKGPGGRYLIWHSAGSGKTKTIAWLSHRLIRHVDSEAHATFDSVIVVTDRTVLDENIRGDMGLVQSSKGLVVTVGEKSGAKSPQLKKALIEGDHIITCTLQTFPEVMKLIEDTSELRGRNWAVVADEAHSSQSGSSARGLKALLADIDVEDPENVSADELLAAKDSAIAASSNITFIALTATPKAKTLRLFGEQDEDGNWRAFDTYTMAQAIEEGFILDVLTNYSTYDMFLRVKNELENSEEETLVDTGHAVTAIVQFARLHPTAIAQKVRVVVEHFHRNVKPLLTGSARAMVVTSSRIEAYRWFEAMNAYIDKAGYSGIRPLVAFSGSLESDDGEIVTEASLNGRNDTARAFREEDYKILIVANKFQTGFDEPRLMAMYVDKKLSGIAAVQTLSRLNRTYPGKTAPMVVDFQNTPASIQDDFKMYYSDARVVGEVDPNSLITIAERLDTAGIYTMQEMTAVADAYLSDAGGEAIAKALGPIKGRWQSEWNHARRIKDNELKDSLRSFRADTISYRNAWQFLSQIVDYQDPDLHKRAILATLLSRNLHMEGNQYDDSYLEGVQLSGVQLVPSAINEDHSLSEGSDEAMGLPGFDGEYRGSQTPAKGPLTEVIERVNEMFRVRNIDVAEGSVAGFISTFWGFLGEDEAAQAMAKNNSPSQLKASADFSHAVGIAMLRTCQENQEIQSYMQDQSFLQNIVEITADALQAQHSRDGNSSGNVAE